MRINGQALREARQANEISLSEMASTVGITAGYLSQIERHDKAVSADLADKLIDAIGAAILQPADEPPAVPEAPAADAAIIPTILLSIDQAAHALNLSRSKVKQLCAEGTLPSGKEGRRRLIPMTAVQQYADSLIKTRAAS